MARYPLAEWLPLDFAGSLPAHTPIRCLAHTNGGPGSVPTLPRYFSDRWRQTGKRIGSHFQVDRNGRVGQYADTSQATFTAFHADPGSISIETQDDGDHLEPWTTPQLAALIDLCRWIVDVHPSIPPVLCPAEDGAGFAGHQAFASWNLDLHDCPGPVRGRQWRGLVLPQLAPARPPANPRGDRMPPVLVRKAVDPARGPVYLVESGQRFYVDTVRLGLLAEACGLTTAQLRGLVWDLPENAAAWQLPANVPPGATHAPA